ncbi:MAG TPA: NAD-dependent epimerase/dehydratase family protein [Nitrospira sp.]|nr:NAD-dependent epimerase/dehydratase family protein [Nitrospira sp.]MBX3369227.1 NAD-dependent epimerase/dehydratase family protein [Nitrospira sp.]HMZ56160.1 NAD-dependent epimerase/dehydratase family protein [Nitrospira sp.]HNI69648.1 NAD-dependent epimerase/dehydratase family protein [Nitrospira sp.]HNK14733.1 NAD-dependent epimerase/dehydratase family protein [Nitrospira sp.]
MKAPVLVTGGAGCIGIQVCRELDRRGIEVHLLDLGEQIARVRKALPQKAKIFYGSILDISSIREAMDGCGAVIHLAALLGVRRTEVNRLRCLEINVDGTKRVLDCAIQHRIKRLVFASSSEVYGEPIENPITEETITQGKTVYAVSKLAGEELCIGYAQRYPEFEPVILRFFNAYGPYQAAQFVLPKFIQNAMTGKPIVINGSGDQIRSYCYAEDTARGVVEALLRPEAVGQVINLGNSDRPISLKQLADLVIKASGNSSVEIKYAADFQGTDRHASREIHRRYCSGEKAKQLLGFESRVSLEEGIRRIIEMNSIFEKWESTELPYLIDEMT